MIGALAAVLRRPRPVLTATFVLFVAGLFAYLTIPKEANPDIDIPVFYVSVSQQGVSPEDAERLLARPLETRLRSLDGLKEVTAVASEGHAGIVLEFDIDFDKESALADVRAKVDEAAAELPADADEPTITETNFSLLPTITVALSGDVPERTLHEFAHRLQDAIESIPSVLEAKLSGDREELLEVIIDTLRLESYGISQQELIEAVNNNNQLVAAGALDEGEGRFNVKVPGLFQTPQDVMNLPVKVSGDGMVTLGDVAEIRATFQDPTSFAKVNGKPAISIDVVKRLGVNIIANNEAVRAVVDQATASWPESIRVDYLLDQSSFIHEVVGDLEGNVITAVALVLIITLAALGFQSSLLVGLAIPISFLMGFMFLSGLGLTLNMMVLFSLIVTAGIVVDGATVVVEYADRRIAEGVPREEAYIRATRQMFWPVVAGTCTTVSAFLPMLLWPGVAGEFMSYLPKMAILVMAASLVTALIIIPTLGRLIGRRRVSAQEKATGEVLAAGRDFDPRALRGPLGVYTRFVARAARWPAVSGLAIVGLVAGAFVLYSSNPTGVEFFVEDEPDQAIVLVSARGNLSVAQQRDLVVEVEREILQVDGIESVFLSAGAGDPGSGVMGVQDKPADAIGQLSMQLEDFPLRRRAVEIFEEIRARTADISGIKVEVRKVEGGPPTGKAVRLQITADDYATALATAARVREHFDRNVADIRDVEDSRPLPGIEWRLDVDRAEAGRFGADVLTVGNMVRLVTNGVLVGKYRPDTSDDEVDIRVRVPREERSLDRLDALTVSTPGGFVPLRNFVTREPQQQVTSITRRDGRYAMDVKADVTDGVLADDKVGEIQAWLDGETWTPGVEFRFRGADEEQKESGAFLQVALLGALFLMFGVLVTQFNSFYQTFLTLTTVVMSIAGVLLGMLIFDQPFSIIMTGTGILALAGVVVNNAIILIDAFNTKRAAGIPTEIAAIATAAERLRPVLLTTVTTIVGLIPAALQINVNFIERTVQFGSITSPLWAQMSTAIISGLTFATILTLVFVPVMLAAPAVWKRSLSGIVGRFRAKPAPDAEAPRVETPLPGYREAAE